MAVEILTVSLSDESIGRLAMHIASLLKAPVPTTDSNPPSPEFPQSAEPSGFSQQPDPWQNRVGTPPSQQNYPQQAPPQQQYQQGSPPAVQQGPPQRFCPHGEMRFVPAGTNSQGKSYNAVYGCTLQRGDPNQCKPVRV